MRIRRICVEFAARMCARQLFSWVVEDVPASSAACILPFRVESREGQRESLWHRPWMRGKFGRRIRGGARPVFLKAAFV